MYGEKEAVIEVIPGSNYTLSVGDATFTGAAAEVDDDLTEIKIDLGGILYDLGTPVTLTATKQGCTAIESSKVESDTWIGKIKASRKTFSVKTYNLHKGDVVKVRYSGKTYSKKITKNYHGKYYTVKVKARKKIAKNAKITFWVENKYKTILDGKTTARLYKYKWTDTI